MYHISKTAFTVTIHDVTCNHIYYIYLWLSCLHNDHSFPKSDCYNNSEKQLSYKYYSSIHYQVTNALVQNNRISLIRNQVYQTKPKGILNWHNEKKIMWTCVHLSYFWIKLQSRIYLIHLFWCFHSPLTASSTWGLDKQDSTVEHHFSPILVIILETVGPRRLSSHVHLQVSSFSGLCP